MRLKDHYRIILIFILSTCIAVSVLISAYKIIRFDQSAFNGIFGLINSVVGGLISGVLTYLGVLLTLQKQDNEKFKETLPSKVVVVDQFLRTLNTIINRIEVSLNKYEIIEVIYENLYSIREHTEEAMKHLGGNVGVRLYVNNNHLANLNIDFNQLIEMDDEELEEKKRELVLKVCNSYQPLIIEMKSILDVYLNEIVAEGQKHKLF